MSTADLTRWPADVRDTCGNVFGQSLRAAQPALKADARVYEIGCAEFDWLTHATTAWPDMMFTGIDWRACKPKPEQARVTRIKGDVLAQVYPPASFDWIVGVSSIEHIGLGHYKQDPKAEDGDVAVMCKAYEWLAPGGWMYLDVPWMPGQGVYHVHGTSHRVYDTEAIYERLNSGGGWISRWEGVYSLRGELVTDPVRVKGGESFYYRAFWLQKGLADAA